MKVIDSVCDMLVMTKSTRADSEVMGIVVEFKDGSIWFYPKSDGADKLAPYPVRQVINFLQAIGAVQAVDDFIDSLGIDKECMSLLSRYAVYSALNWRQFRTEKEIVVGLWDFPNAVQGYATIADLLPEDKVPLFFGMLNGNAFSIEPDATYGSVFNDFLLQRESLQIPITPIFEALKEATLRTARLLSSPINGLCVLRTPSGKRYGLYRIPAPRNPIRDLLKGTDLELGSAVADFINDPVRTAMLCQRMIHENIDGMEEELRLFINKRTARLLVKILEKRYPSKRAKPKEAVRKQKPPKLRAGEDKSAVKVVKVDKPEPITKTKPISMSQEARRIVERKKQSLPVDMIVGGTKDFVIGKNNTLPWHIPEDLQFFKEFTTGAILIMGRKTYESLPKALNNRHLIVITSTPEKVEQRFGNVDMSVVRDFDEALHEAVNLRLDNPNRRVIVAGGGKVYKDAQLSCNRLIYVFNDLIVTGKEEELVKYKPHDSMVEVMEQSLPTKDHGNLTVKVYNNVLGRLR